MNDKEASDIIEAALNKALSQNEDYQQGDVVVDWLLTAYVTNPDKEKGGGLAVFLSNGVMPEYRVKGLLEQTRQDMDIRYMISLGEDDED